MATGSGGISRFPVLPIMRGESMKLYQLLKKLNANGKERAVSTERLMRLTGLTQRGIRHLVNRERKKHFICSTTTGNGGYFRPANRNEIKSFLAVQEQRIKRHAVSIRLSRRLMKRGK
ncbi:hypothetical protein [uncultured Megasphaera sp.]|uniref:hypothetical protein n=1 Tax=uncultured Megasphaera sp. TaxID=165188 RepID=UPI00260AB683|nr:hypothetical protein [uncultured Megasphaera sp.]